MNKPRQRRRHLAALIGMAGVLCAAACSQAASNDVRSAATAFAGVQATVQPVSTRVADALSRLQPSDLGRLIGTTMGANVEITLTPPGAPNDQVTQATLDGTDRTGAFGRLDDQARRSFAGAALQLARQAYPQATITLNVVDSSGTSLLAATYPPGGQPAFQ
jgi:hypothetical protein